MTKVGIKASCQSIGAVRRIRPPHMVKIQLKTFTPVGMAISIVETPKKA